MSVAGLNGRSGHDGGPDAPAACRAAWRDCWRFDWRSGRPGWYGCAHPPAAGPGRRARHELWYVLRPLGGTADPRAAGMRRPVVCQAPSPARAGTSGPR